MKKVLIETKDLSKEFTFGKKISFKKDCDQFFRALNNVSFKVSRGEIYGVVGESGSGKTTLARCLVGLIDSFEGSIKIGNFELPITSRKEILMFRKEVQMVFQDPHSSLNPRMKIIDILSEPLLIQKMITKKEVSDRVVEFLMMVGLSKDVLHNYPREFSGGERQRIGIARAIITKPSLLIADEPVSALDVSIQAQIINLLLDLREQLGLTMIFISHDLRLVRFLCDRIGVFYLGRLIEEGLKDELFNNACHPYTKMLLSSMPRLGTVPQQFIKQRALFYDEIKREDFHDFCPYKRRCSERTDICDHEPLKDMWLSATHRAACHNLQNS